MTDKKELTLRPEVSITFIDVHEAAHAVVGAVLQIPFQYVTTIPRVMDSAGLGAAEFGGYVVFEPFRFLYKGTPKENDPKYLELEYKRFVRFFESQVQIAQAGRIMEEKFGYQPDASSRFRYLQDEAEEERAISILRDYTDSDGKDSYGDDWIEQTRRNTAEMLNDPKIALAVSLTAYELSMKGKVSSKRVRHILKVSREQTNEFAREWWNLTMKSIRGEVAA